MKKLTVAAVMSLGAFAALGADDTKTDSFKVHFAERATGAITIDGKFDEADWKTAEPILDWGPTTFLRRQPVAKPETYLKYLWDDKYLYVAMRCGEEDFPEENMKLFRKNDFNKAQPVYNRDCVELHLDGNNDRHTKFQIWFSPTEEKSIIWHYDFGWGLLENHDYGLTADWDYKVSVDDKGWQFEGRLALAHFEMTGKPGNICAAEPCRFRMMKHMKGVDGKDLGVTTRLWGWSTQGGEHHETPKYGKIIFVDKKPASLVEGLRLVYKDLDERKIFVQTTTDYNLVEKGEVKKIPYLDKAKELLAATDKLLARSEALYLEPAPKNFFMYPSNAVVKAREEFAKLNAKIAGKPTCDIATLAEITEWTKKTDSAVDTAYFNSLAGLLRSEKKVRHPVKLAYDPTLPVQDDDERPNPPPETRALPHLDWAKTLAVKPAKTLIVVNSYGTIDAYSLKARLGLDADVFYMQPSPPCDGEDYWHEGFFGSLKHQRILENMLAKNGYRDFVFLGLTPTYFTARLQCWLLEQMLEGSRLVMVGNGWNHWNFNSILKKNPELASGTIHDIPAVADYDETEPGFNLYKVKDKSVNAAGVETGAFGQGQITAYNAGAGQNYMLYCAMSACPYLKPDRAFDDEYLYGATVRAIMQGLGLRGDRRALELTVGIDGTAAANRKPEAALTVTGEKEWSGKVRYEVRDTWGKVVQAAKTLDVSVPAGAKHISLDLAPLPAGRFVITAWLTDAQGGVLDFASGEALVKDASGSKCECNPLCKRTLPPAVVSEVKLAKECFEEKEPVAAQIKIANAVKGMTVEALVRDPRKRIIEKAAFEVNPETGVADVRFDFKRLGSGCNFLETKLLLGKKTLAEGKVTEFYRHVPRHDDYEIFADPCQFGGQMGDLRDAIMQHYGVQLYQTWGRGSTYRGGNPVYRHWISGRESDKGGTLSSPWYPWDLNRMYKREAIALKGINGHFLSLGDDSGDSRAFSKGTPDWVPVFIDAMREKFDREIKPGRDLGVLLDEWGRSRKFPQVRRSNWRWGFQQPVMKNVKALLNCDLKPEDLALFKNCLPRAYKNIEYFNRQHGTAFKNYNEINAETIKTLNPVAMPEFVNFCLWLRDRYQNDIAKLNAHWKSSFKDFFSVEDAWIDEQKFRKNFTASIVRAIYFEDNFINQFRAIAGAVRSVDPTMGVGLCASGLGNAMPEVLEHLNTVGNYLGGEEIELMRCLPHVYLGETIGVYGGRLVPLPMREREVYHGLFSGANFSWFWATCYAINGNLAVQENRARRQLETYREVTRGTGALCVRAKRQNDGIRILASRTAGRLEPLVAGGCTHEQARRSFGAVIEDLGLQYDYLTTHQLEKGVSGDVKVLVLASVQTLTDKELAAIKAFVKRGGKVLCDVVPAIADNYGNLLEKPMLAETDYTLLGFKPASYTFLRGRGELGTMRVDTLAKFASWGIKPLYKTLNEKGEEVTNVEYSRFVRDGVTCLGYEKIANSYETFPMKANLALEKPMHVYESRSGKYLGLTDKAAIELTGLDCCLFTLLPYEVTGVSVQTPAKIKKGETLKVKAQAEVARLAAADTKIGTHVLRFELVPPGGYDELKYAPVAHQVLDAPKGYAEADFAIAYNEAVEYFTLVVTDVMTGKSFSKKITVTK